MDMIQKVLLHSHGQNEKIQCYISNNQKIQTKQAFIFISDNFDPQKKNAININEKKKGGNHPLF